MEEPETAPGTTTLDGLATPQSGRLDLTSLAITATALSNAFGLIGAAHVGTTRAIGGVAETTWAWDDLSSLPVCTGEYDQTGSLTTSWLPDPTSTEGAALAESSGGVSSWLLSDPSANITSAITTTGSTVSGTRTMDAFGVTRAAATGSLAGSAIGFAGLYLESATGLYDMRARDYDPSSGRFTANYPVAVPTGIPYVAGSPAGTPRRRNAPCFRSLTGP